MMRPTHREDVNIASHIICSVGAAGTHTPRSVGPLGPEEHVRVTWVPETYGMCMSLLA